MKTKIALVFLVSAGLLFPSLPAFAATGHDLDGKTYSGTITTAGEAKGDPDTFIFKNGTFDSTACHQYGYGAGSYSATTDKGVVNFTAETKNDTGAHIKWSGKVINNKISGTATMYAASGEKTNMTFEGSLEART